MPRKFFSGFTLITFVLIASYSFAQTGSGQVSGTVFDSTNSVIPSVTIKLTNTDTNVMIPALSNESGVYNFAGVQAGPYKVQAELMGFKTIVISINVGVNAQVRQDFKMEVGNVTTAIEVSAQGDVLQTESTASVGVVIPEQKVRDLPLVGGNVLDLLNILPGFRESAFGDAFSTVGGLDLDFVNATVNGLSTNSSRNSAGPGFLNGGNTIFSFGSGRQVFTP